MALSISEQVKDPMPRLREFRKTHHLSYPILSDEKGTVITRFGFNGIPQDVILDKTGKYVSAPTDVNDVVAQVKKLTK